MSFSREYTLSPALKVLLLLLYLEVTIICSFVVPTPSTPPTNAPSSQRSSLGIMYTVAGTGAGGLTPAGAFATSSMIHTSRSVYQDSAGRTYIGELYNQCVRMIDSSGILNNFAGVCAEGTGSYSGDGGPATSAIMNEPVTIVISTTGNAYISEFNNCRIRSVSTSEIGRAHV